MYQVFSIFSPFKMAAFPDQLMLNAHEKQTNFQKLKS